VIGDRIKEVRKISGLTQQRFAERLNLKRNTIGNYEINLLEPSDRTIADICRVFNVNETWLRTGEGEMFATRTRAQEITDFMGELILSGNDFKSRFIAALARLDEKDWALIEKMAEMLRKE